MSFLRKKPKVSVDDTLIRELLTRGVERVYPTKEALERELQSGRRLTLYFGIDPTGPTLHLGHAVSLLKLRQFQNLGHSVIVLYGGFTAQIGDPSGKGRARPQLSAKEVKKNAAGYRKLIGKILDLKKANVRFLDNEEWSNKLKPADMVKLASRFTVAQVLERDMFQERQKRGEEIYLHEFLYPVFQAYDAVTMDVDIQVGGNDQTFNMLAGRTLMRKMKNKEKFIVVMKLLIDPAGKKMGKTDGNMVALSDAPADIFGKIMSWPDGMILTGFELCTTIPLAEIEEVKKALTNGENPRNLKARLAAAVVSLLYGGEAAQKARRGFDAAFKEGKPEEFIEVAPTGNGIAEALIEKRVVSSKTELRRLIAEGAVTNLDTNAKMGEDFLKVAPPGKYRIGKHRFIKIR